MINTIITTAIQESSTYTMLYVMCISLIISCMIWGTQIMNEQGTKLLTTLTKAMLSTAAFWITILTLINIMGA